MLHSLRRRLAEMAEREAAGESLWTPAFSDRVRTRILHALHRTVGNPVSVSVPAIFAEAQRLVREQEGVFTLTGERRSPSDDFLEYLQLCPDDMYPTLIEALIPALDRADQVENQVMSYPEFWAHNFTNAVNEILAQERVGWELIDGRM